MATSRQRERDHLSRELHDGVQPRLATLRMQLALARQQSDSTPALTKVETILDELQGELRAALDGLRVPWLQGRSLGEALKALIEEWGAMRQVQIEDELANKAELPPHLADAAFRFLQEALANALRHAGATQITLSLRADAEAWSFICRDNGTGFVPEGVAKGYGMATMRERAELFGGIFTIDSQPNRGTVVTWQQPIHRALSTSG